MTDLIAGTPAMVDNEITFTPDADLTNDTPYALFRRATDINGKVNSGMISFTTVAV